MLITAPYQNNIITRAHPTIILVTRDRLLLSLPWIFREIVTFTWKGTLRICILVSVFTSPFLLMEIRVSSRLMKKRFNIILENYLDDVSRIPLLFSSKSIFTPMEEGFGDIFSIFKKLREKFRDRIEAFVWSRNFENFGKFRTINFI